MPKVTPFPTNPRTPVLKTRFLKGDSVLFFSDFVWELGGWAEKQKFLFAAAAALLKNSSEFELSEREREKDLRVGCESGSLGSSCHRSSSRTSIWHKKRRGKENEKNWKCTTLPCAHIFVGEASTVRSWWDELEECRRDVINISACVYFFFLGSLT